MNTEVVKLDFDVLDKASAVVHGLKTSLRWSEMQMRMGERSFIIHEVVAIQIQGVGLNNFETGRSKV